MYFKLPYQEFVHVETIGQDALSSLHQNMLMLLHRQTHESHINKLQLYFMQCTNHVHHARDICTSQAAPYLSVRGVITSRLELPRYS